MLVQPLISHYYVKISKTTSVIFLYLCRKRSRVNCKRVEMWSTSLFYYFCCTICYISQSGGRGGKFPVHGFKKNIIRPLSIKTCHQCELSVVLTIRLGGNRDSHRWAILFLILWHWTETNFSKNTFKTHLKKKIKLADNWKQRFSQGYHWLWTS